MRTKGFTLIELLVALMIIAILAGVAIPYITRYYRAYRYNEYVLQVESTLKWARLIAMERGINTLVCLQGQNLSIVNRGQARDLNCTGQVIRSVLVDAGDQGFVNIQANNFPVGFDPRGLAFTNGGEGTITVRRTDGVNTCTQYVVRNMSAYVERRACQ
ncbi:MAG: prepilin-type N-terminal cleavage/methylation domain-containing protein [Nitrososphaerota archaeon]